MNICYLAPQLTALESTFVYEELLAIEKRGLTVIPTSVKRAEKNFVGYDGLLQRTHFLYDENPVKTLLYSLVAFFRMGTRQKGSIRLLMSDIFFLGFFNKSSWKLLFQYIVACRLAEILIENQCKHLHVHFAHTAAQIAMYASAMSAVPFTIMAHANDIFERGLLLDRKAQRAVKLLTISEFNRHYLISQNVSEDKLAVVRCGVSFHISNETRQFKKKDCYRIGTLARLVEKKGIDNLIQAIGELRNSEIKIKLCIAGDGPLLRALKKQTEELGLKDIVSFEAGLDHKEVSTWMKNLDVFVLACKKDSNGDMDGIPVVLMEAMSQSIPVISTKLSGIPELIIDGQTGLLAEPADPVNLADKIKQLIKSPDLCEKLVANAKKHVVEEFGQKVNIDRLLQYFALDEI